MTYYYVLLVRTIVLSRASALDRPKLLDLPLVPTILPLLLPLIPLLLYNSTYPYYYVAHCVRKLPTPSPVLLYNSIMQLVLMLVFTLRRHHDLLSWRQMVKVVDLPLLLYYITQQQYVDDSSLVLLKQYSDAIEGQLVVLIIYNSIIVILYNILNNILYNITALHL